MDRAYQSGAAGSAPAAPGSPSTGYPTAGNPGTGTPATKPGPYWYHMIMEELLAIISAAGITPAQGNLTQLLTALRSAGVFQTPSQFDNTTKAATTAFVKLSGNTLSQFNAYASSVTLAAAVAGSLVEFYGSTAGQTITLPLSSAVNVADEIIIFNYATVSVTVQRQGADQIAYGGNSGANSITLLPGDSAVLCAGTSLWMLIGGTSANKYSNGFQVSAGIAGYQKLPSGTIYQWGGTASAIAGDLVQTLPIAFPNYFERVIVTQAYTPGSGSIGYAGAIPTTLSTFTWRGSAVGSGFQYLAIGR